MKLQFLTGKKNLFFLALYFSDVAMFLVAVLCSAVIFADYSYVRTYARFFLFTLLILMINHSAFGLYKDKRTLFDDNDFMKTVYSTATTCFITMLLVLMFGHGNLVLIQTTGLALFMALFATSISRLVLYKIIYLFRRLGHDRKKVLFFGHNNTGLITKIAENRELGYDIIKITSSEDVLKRYLDKVDIVFLAREQVDDSLLKIMIDNDRVNWKIVSSILNLVVDPVAFDEFKDYPIINMRPSQSVLNYPLLKRFMDIVLSGAALFVLSPLFLVVSILIKITMPGPVFFKQERLGKDLKLFMFYKFRTMIVGADKQKTKLSNEVSGLFKMKDDPRVTKLGKLLRRSCIDELPQLINILKGDMSIVGPRPHLKIELRHFRGWRRARFKVKPGLTGMWQVNGRHELNFDKAILYDVYYMRHMSFILDAIILLRTIPSILITRGRY